MLMKIKNILASGGQQATHLMKLLLRMMV